MEVQYADIFIKGITLLVLLGNTAATIWLFVRRRNDQRITEIERRQDEMDERIDQANARLSAAIVDRNEKHSELTRRLSVIEAKMEGVPTHRDLEEIRKNLATVAAQGAALNERSAATHSLVQTLSDHLLERGK